MVTIKNYALGNWIKGDGEGNPLYNAINGNQIGTASWTRFLTNDELR